METGMNTLQRRYKIYHNCFSTLPDKTKTTQNSTFWSQSSQYFIAQQQERVYELSELFLQFVFKMSVVCTDTENLYIPIGFWSKFYLQNSTYFI